jgi:hypothetical protein
VAVSNPNEVNEFCQSPNPSNRTVTLGFTQPLTGMSTRNLLGGEARPAHKADNLWADFLANVGLLKSQNPTGLYDLLQG